MSAEGVKKIVGNMQLLLRNRSDTYVNHLNVTLPLF